MFEVLEKNLNYNTFQFYVNLKMMALKKKIGWPTSQLESICSEEMFNARAAMVTTWKWKQLLHVRHHNGQAPPKLGSSSRDPPVVSHT